MMVVLLVAGIGFLLAGLLAVVFGIPVKEFSFGNTLILTGAILACTGAMLLGLWTVVRELKNIAREPGVPRQLPAAGPSAALSATLGDQAPEDGGFLFGGDRPAPENAEPAAGPPPWHEEAASRDRVRIDAPAPAEPVEAAAKPKRNLLFASSSRKERERAQARPAESPAADSRPPPPAAAPVAESGEPPPATFDDAWPKPERARTADTPPPPPPPLRSARAPSTFTEPAAGAAGTVRSPPPVRTQDQPEVTVLKSGVVDGMAYSLYSDGSIEAQMPEGMMRFASIDELRAHLDHRP
jgi:hypothetical protein